MSDVAQQIETDPINSLLYELAGVQRIFKLGGTEVRAVDGVNFSISSGEFIAILGPSGSGKSTMLQLLGALDKATQGSIKLDGRELSDFSDGGLTNLRAHEIGFVFQTFNLIPTLTAVENVEIAYSGGGDKQENRSSRALKLLADVGLADRADHLPSLMSGGEQQRVAICRALVNRPRVILADEPTGNLDTATADEILGILRKQTETRNVTVIIVTHDEEIAARASRRIRMRDGKILGDTINATA